MRFRSFILWLIAHFVPRDCRNLFADWTFPCGSRKRAVMAISEFGCQQYGPLSVQFLDGDRDNNPRMVNKRRSLFTTSRDHPIRLKAGFSSARNAAGEFCEDTVNKTF